MVDGQYPAHRVMQGLVINSLVPAGRLENNGVFPNCQKTPGAGCIAIPIYIYIYMPCVYTIHI